MRRACPEHHVFPRISIWGNRLQIECCCEEFRQQLLRESESLIYQAINEDMRREIRRM